MIAYIIGRNLAIKNTMTSESEKYRIVDDLVTVSESVTCELKVSYTGRASDLCEAGEFVFFPGRDVYSSFFQILSCDVDYLKNTVTIYGDNSLLIWFSQRSSTGGSFGRASEIGKSIEWYLNDFTGTYEITSSEIVSTATGDTTASTAKEALNKTAELFNCEISLAYALKNGTVTPSMVISKKNNGLETGEVLTIGRDLQSLSKTEDCTSVCTSVYLRGGVKASHVYASLNELIADENLDEPGVVIVLTMAYKVVELQVVTRRSLMTDPNKVYKLNGTCYVGNPSGTGQATVTGYETDNGMFAYHLTASTVDTTNEYVYTPLPTYDDGDYFVNNGRIVSRSAWARYGVADNPATLRGFANEIAYHANDLETTDQTEVLNTALALIETYRNPSVTFECECNKRVSYGAYYTLAVPNESVYISARCLETEESETQGTYKPTFGNYMQKNNAYETMAKNTGG